MPEYENNMEGYLNEQLEISKERIVRLHTLNAIMEKSSATSTPFAVSKTVQQLDEAVVNYHSKPESAAGKTIIPAKK